MSFLSLAFGLFLFFAVIYLLIRPIIRGGVYFPTMQPAVQAMVRLAEAKPGERVADLGSGDGRILIAFARQGIEIHGYEINPILVIQSRIAIRRAGLSGKACVHWQSFWRANLSRFDVVVVYGIPYIMAKLGEKLEQELTPASRVLSNIYEFPRWNVSSRDGVIRGYVMPPRAEG